MSSIIHQKYMLSKLFIKWAPRSFLPNGYHISLVFSKGCTSFSGRMLISSTFNTPDEPVNIQLRACEKRKWFKIIYPLCWTSDIHRNRQAIKQKILLLKSDSWCKLSAMQSWCLWIVYFFPPDVKESDWLDFCMAAVTKIHIVRVISENDLCRCCFQNFSEVCGIALNSWLNEKGVWFWWVMLKIIWSSLKAIGMFQFDAECWMSLGNVEEMALVQSRLLFLVSKRQFLFGKRHSCDENRHFYLNMSQGTKAMTRGMKHGGNCLVASIVLCMLMIK